MIRFTVGTRRSESGPAAVIEVGGKLYDIGVLSEKLAGKSVRELLADWDGSLEILQQCAETVTSGQAAASGGHADLLAPILYPDKFLAVGANYADHLKEMGLTATKWDTMPFFLRPPTTTLVGPGETVRIPKSTQQFDWECELAVIVGKPLSHASKEEAAAAVAGYAVGFDLSCRDLIPVQNELHVDLVRGKCQDTMGPCGPTIMPAKFVPDTSNLRIQLWVNDEKMMDATTSQMLYKLDEQLSVISEYITLLPGDILFTGSPSGSAGVHGDRWLKPGDRVKGTIEQVGTLEVTMQA